jgi:hypothetical protein
LRRVWINKNWISYFRLGRTEFKKKAKAIEATSDDKQVLFIKVLRIFIKPGWGMYFLTRRYHIGTFGKYNDKLVISSSTQLLGSRRRNSKNLRCWK